jgi:uncharacterized coiled-coil protein SlyX
MQELEHRVIKLEVRVDNHEEDLAELRDTSIKLTTALQAIEKNLAQLKWLAIGAVVSFVAKDMGFYQTLKILLGGS